MDLVNDNYQAFLGLGSSLKGGEEKVEEVKVGLLGFRREIEGLQSKVEGRRKEIEGLIDERRAIASEVKLGRNLLEIYESLEELEERLAVMGSGSGGNGFKEDGYDFSESDDESDDEGKGRSFISVSRLTRRVEEFIRIKNSMLKIGLEHPFLVKQEGKLLSVKQTLLLDLSTAMKQNKGSNETDKTRLLRLLGIYRNMGETHEAITALKGIR